MTDHLSTTGRNITKPDLPGPGRPWLFKGLIAVGFLLLAAAVIGLFWTNRSANGETGAPVRIGAQMARFELQDIQGKTVRLSDYAGKTVLVNAWATWCPPCRAEMPALNAFYQQHRAQGFVILAINAGESQAQAADFASANQLQFPVLLDQDENLMDRLSIHDYPTSILIGKDGVVKTIHVGMLTQDALQNEILPLIQ